MLLSSKDKYSHCESAKLETTTLEKLIIGTNTQSSHRNYIVVLAIFDIDSYISILFLEYTAALNKRLAERLRDK